MSRNPACSVYIGNLDEKVSDRVLYEILIQAGRVVDLHIPKDKETNRQKGFAFAEYETEEVAEYAVKLFSGLVCLNKKTLKFAISGRDRSSQNSSTHVAHANHPLPNININNNCPIPLSIHYQDRRLTQVYAQTVNSRVSSSAHSASSTVYSQVSPNGLSSGNYEYSKRVLGSVLNISRPASRNPVPYPSY